MSYPLVELGSIANFINGYAFKPTHWENGGKPIIRIQNLTDPSKPFNYTSLKIADKYLVEKGDLLVSWSATLDVFEWDSEDALLNQHIFKIEPDFNKIDKNYLRYALKEAIASMMKFTRGSTMKHVNRGDFLGTKIPLPPLAVQKQIAAVLEKADTLRSQCQQMEQELNALAQSVFLDMFGDFRKMDKTNFLPLGDCADVCSGITKGQKFGDKPTVIVPYMRVANVQDGYLDLSEVKNIEAKVSDFDKYLLQAGDVLMTEGGDHDKLGRGAVWDGKIENCIHQNHVFRVRLHGHYLPKFFEYLLQSQYAKQYFLKCAKKTTNLASINITQLKSLPMPPLSLSKQHDFVDFIERLDKQKLHLQEMKDQFCDNFNSLMQRAFKGELKLKGVA
ncbi:MAG: restriction endonuclease subunit S [Oceanospirillaceae bacterium]|nr:restriction endonuclease subunit S [Oceanospirillaceae bacterium]